MPRSIKGSSGAHLHPGQAKRGWRGCWRGRGTACFSWGQSALSAPVSAHLRVKAEVSTGRTPEMSDASTQTEALREGVCSEALSVPQCSGFPPVAPVKDAGKSRICHTRWLSYQRQAEDCVVLERLKLKEVEVGFTAALLRLFLLGARHQASWWPTRVGLWFTLHPPA